jgi:hypothetical protein
MERDGSFSFSQEHARGSYPEPHEFSPHSHIVSSRSILILSYQLSGLRSVGWLTDWPHGDLSWETNSHSVTSSTPVMEPESSLPCSQELTTGLYFEPDASNTHTFPPYFSGSFLILSSHLRLRLPSDLFLSCFRTKILYAFLTQTHLNI